MSPQRLFPPKPKVIHRKYPSVSRPIAENPTEELKLLGQEQKKNPINKDRFVSLVGYRFNGTQNYLPGLSAQSLSFSTIIQKPNYRKVLGLPANVLDAVEDFRKLRNQIHLPGDPVDTPNIAQLPSVSEFIINFINQYIVAKVHELSVRHGLSLGREVIQMEY